MADIIRSFRAKMIVLLALSMLIAGTITFLIYKGLQLYYHTNVKVEDPLFRLRIIMNIYGDLNFFLIIFIPLSILFFFFLTKPYATYFNKISNGINDLANGDFKSKVDIVSRDEFQDIAEDINRASEKLQEAVERGDFAESSKDQLVLNLAHDLRTPLTSVLGYLDFILREEDLPAERIRHFTKIAYTKSQRLEKLIDELFEITRMNYGMLPLEKKSLNLSELLIQLSEELYPLFEKNHLSARLNLISHLDILGDGDLLARVFENLLTNAVRYGNDGHFVDILGFTDKGEVVVQVINYGTCIPEEELPYVFDMFYTNDKARSHKDGSTGLGLFIVKNIVEQHNGTISVKSDSILTLFEVRLPQ